MKTSANKGTQLVKSPSPPEWGEVPAGRRGANMPGRSYSSDNYRFGFNGKENDNEIKGTGNSQDYGFRCYDTRACRFMSVDPLTRKYPMLTPYQFASNRFIDGVDLDGKEFLNSTTITTFSSGSSGGIGYGYNVAIKNGTAYDMIGQTQFTAYSAIGFSGQNLNTNTENAKFILGGDISVRDFSVDFAFNKPTFSQAMESMNLSFSGIKIKDFVGGGVSIGESSFGLSVGVGWGATFKSGNQTEIKQSISLTYDESDGLTSSIWSVGQSSPVMDKSGTVTGYKATMGILDPNTHKFVPKGITVYSGATQSTDSKGKTKTAPTGDWKSSDYIKAEKKLTD